MRRIFRCMGTGFLLGAALSQAGNLLLSYMLKLGYYAPCLAALNEVFGGELNAAAAQWLGAGLLGAGIGLAMSEIGKKSRGKRRA